MVSDDVFRFKQFAVRHANSSMRVGTDAVLLGAWTDMGVCAKSAATSVLDVGCGCGVIALMSAQRSVSSHVLGIDIDAASICEAMENAFNSPFAGRVEFRRIDLRDFACMEHSVRYDLILCNPPYYTEDTLPPDRRRSLARNATHLSFRELLDSVVRLLHVNGVFAVVLPMQARDRFVGEAIVHGLYIRRECRVQTVSRKPPKRVMLEFDFNRHDIAVAETLVLQDTDGRRTAEYSALCSAFYL